jgi:hypothetical protein
MRCIKCGKPGHLEFVFDSFDFDLFELGIEAGKEVGPLCFYCHDEISKRNDKQPCTCPSNDCAGV